MVQKLKLYVTNSALPKSKNLNLKKDLSYSYPI